MASRPNERWAIDLIDMNRYSKQNKNYRYILTCIDHFSRYVWARPLKLKNSNDVTDAMRNICEKAGVYPHLLQRDNGGEFAGRLTTWLNNHDIKGIKTLSYSPQSNGLIENFNSQMRKMLRELMIRNNDMVWYDKLDLCCSIKNNQRNSTIKRRPIDVWKSAPCDRFERYKNRDVAINIKEKARRNVEKNTTQELQVGDYVRVKMSQLYSQVRKMIKDGDKKYVTVKYSPEIYVIDHVLKPDNEGYEKLRYTLVDLDGNPLKTQLKRNNPNKPRRQKRFFASDFIKIDSKDLPANLTHDDGGYKQRDGFDIHDALKLNVIQDEETEAKKPKKAKQAKQVRIKREPVPLEPREKSTRTRKPNSMLKDFVETNDKDEITKVLGGGFVFIGGVKHFLI